MPRFACPHCQAIVTASDDERGTMVTCGNCSQQFKVPGGRPKARPRPVPDDDDDEDDDRPRPRRKRRRQQTGDSTKWILIGVLGGVVGIVLVCGVVGFLVVRKIQTAGEDLVEGLERAAAQAEAERAARRANATAITATQLLREYQANPDAAEEKYFDTFLKVTGTIDRVRRQDGIYQVLLRGTDKNPGMRVVCAFDRDTDDPNAEAAQLQKLRSGQQVTIVGEWYGSDDEFGSDISMYQCELVK